MKELVAPKHFAPKLFEPLKCDRRTNDFWGIDGVSVREDESYEHTFKNLLEYLGINSFPNYLQERKTHGLTNHVLDLMGGAYFVPAECYEFLDSITGVRLSDPHDAYVHHIQSDYEFTKKRNHPQSNDLKLLKDYEWALASFEFMHGSSKRDVVYGSIFETATWSDLDHARVARGIPKFDMIVCRPAGPFYGENILGARKYSKQTLLKYAAVYDRVFELTLARLDQRGEMFLEIPGIISTEWAVRWAQKKAKIHNLRIVTTPSNRRKDERYDYNVAWVKAK